MKALSKPGEHGDGGTLYHNVSDDGPRSWIQRTTVSATVRSSGWAAAGRCRSPRRAAGPGCRRSGRRRNGRVTAVWLQSMEWHVFLVIGTLPVNRVGQEHVLCILTPFWGGKPETTWKVRQRIRATLKWCLAPALRGAQHGRGDDRRRPAGHAVRAGAPPGTALPGGSGSIGSAPTTRFQPEWSPIIPGTIRRRSRGRKRSGSILHSRLSPARFGIEANRHIPCGRHIGYFLPGAQWASTSRTMRPVRLPVSWQG